MLLVGSMACMHNSIFLGRPAKDLDFFVKEDELEAFRKVIERNNQIFESKWLSEKSYVIKTQDRIYDLEVAKPGSTTEEIMRNPIYSKGSVATPETLLMLKLSHKYKKNSFHFLKTMNDIRVLRGYVKDLPDTHKVLLKAREKETYTYAHPKLTQNKTAFFDASVNYVYDHDWIHTKVKLYDKPAYMYFKNEGDTVYCPKASFFAQPEHIRRASVYEETCVLAIERAIVPFGVHRKRAFLMALEKVCTSITSGYFREYAWENYRDILGMYSEDYPNEFLKAVEENTAVPFETP